MTEQMRAVNPEEYRAGLLQGQQHARADVYDPAHFASRHDDWWQGYVDGWEEQRGELDRAEAEAGPPVTTYEYADHAGDTINAWPSTDDCDGATIEVNGDNAHVPLAELAKLIAVLSAIEAFGRR